MPLHVQDTWKLLKRSQDLIIKGFTDIIIADITAGQEIDASQKLGLAHCACYTVYNKYSCTGHLQHHYICCITLLHYITLCCYSISLLLKVIVLHNDFIIKSRPHLAVWPVQFWPYQF